MGLQKYWLIFKLHWQNSLTYPVSFFFWRFRQFLSTLTALTLWTVIFRNTESAFGYTEASMTSYILLTAFLQSLILSTLLNGLASDIYTGTISNLFVKPLKPFRVWITQELADKSMNFSFVLLETVFLILIFQPQLMLPDFWRGLVFLIATFFGAVLLFFIMLLLGTIGFWSNETWGARFLFYMFIDFTAGKLFPLDIFPKLVQSIFLLTPFPYLSYIQTQIFLGNFSWPIIFQSLATQLGWILVLWFFSRKLWNKGLKEYGAMGR